MEKDDAGNVRLTTHSTITRPKHVNYRKRAFDTYAHECAHCGFGVVPVLEVAHIEGDRTNNDVRNLVILCPNCHKMLDLGLIPEAVIRKMRDFKKVANWSKRMKVAGQKAKKTRLKNIAAKKKKRQAAAMKAVATKKKKPVAQDEVDTQDEPPTKQVGDPPHEG